MVRHFCFPCHANVDRKDPGSRLLTHNSRTGFSRQKILRHDGRHFLPRLGHAFFYHSIVRTHNDQRLFFDLHIRISSDPGDPDDVLFQLS